jgi:Ca2+-binding EF-hand superfamily protein
MIMVNHMDAEDQTLKMNRETFKAIDVDYSGMISPAELKLTIESLPELKHHQSD